MTTLCVWSEDYEGTWDTSCKELFQFNDRGPTENGFKYCPYCGKTITSVPFREEDEV